MLAKVDSELCIGCELCVNLCPEVFRMEDGKAVACAAVPEAAQAACGQAKEQCPVDAISITPG
jgi:ferredoxin